MKDIYLTRHARGRMKWRKIAEEEVKETVAYPDKREHLPDERINAFKAIGEKLIRVTYIEEGERIVVLSVVDKNR